jgi:hypothetical protein
MPISGSGWEFHVERLGIQADGKRKRTYGAYQVFLDGHAIAKLSGHLCECIGLGSRVKGGHKRIPQGRYPLFTQFGTRYLTIGYTANLAVPGKIPMPGILLGETKPRTAILIHPGHPPNLYLSSIGCLNPTDPLGPADLMDFSESRSRVIALIDSLRDFAPAAFQHAVSTHIPNAWAVIDGEPMNPLGPPDAEVAEAALAERT